MGVLHDLYSIRILDFHLLMKKRIEMIEPIQKQVFSAIEAYAKQVGADVVLDSANNPTLLYSNPSVDRTQQVIDVLKK